jgi:hypothetical protein
MGSNGWRTNSTALGAWPMAVEAGMTAKQQHVAERLHEVVAPPAVPLLLERECRVSALHPGLRGSMLHAPQLPPLVDEVYRGSDGHHVAAGHAMAVPRGVQPPPPPSPRTAADAAFVIQAKPPPSHLGHAAEQPSRPCRRPTTQLPLPSRPGQTAAAAGPNYPAGVMSSSSSFSSLGESTMGTIFFSKSFDES